jgi:hypothetical protein
MYHVIPDHINRDNVRSLSQNANDRGRFVVVKTRLTTKRREECKERGDYIHIARG